MTDPDRLNPTHLRTLLARTHQLETAATEHLKNFCSHTSGYVAWSGGKDSTAAVTLARKTHPNIPVVFFNSGLEFPETVNYIYQTAEQLSYNFHEILAKPTALEFLIGTGLWEHQHRDTTTRSTNPLTTSLHRILITEPSLTAHNMFGEGEILGLRAQESAGRRIHLAKHKGEYGKKLDGRTVQVCCPLWNWDDGNVNSFLHRENLPANPVYKKLSQLGVPVEQQRAGLILDGNGLEFGRAVWLKQGWPELWENLTECLPALSQWSQ